MGPPPLPRCLLWAAIFIVTNAQTPSFLVVAPRALHVGVDDAVGVQFEWPPGASPPAGDIQVTMYLRNELRTLDCSEQHRVTLNPGNGYVGVQKLQLTPQKVTACQLNDMIGDKYVQLVVQSSVLGTKLRAVSIPVSFRRGYLFIQTDKSIYTPKQAVQIRVFTLDHMMRPTEEFVVVTVTNAHGLTVRKSQRFSEKSIITDKLQIPDISEPGVWKISAHFVSAPESNFTAEFEVKKYVLPNFEVKIIPGDPYFLISQEDFNFRVEARYVYGEKVTGVVYVRVGITDQDGKRNMLRGLEQQVTLVDGDAKLTLTKESILKKINQPMENLPGTSLYLAASVVEKASGALEEKDLTSVKFVSSPYRLNLSKTKRYFVPGTPAQIVVEVSHTDGSPVGLVPIRLSNSDGFIQTLNADARGVVTFRINTPIEKKPMAITVTADGDKGSEVERIHITPYTSRTESFLHMDVPNQVLSPGETLKVMLKAVTPTPNKIKKIYYMVLNKGQLLSLKYITQSDYMELQVPVTSSMIPSFRIVTYYHLGAEIVANSAWVDVTDVCEGKLKLSPQVTGPIAPGGTFKLLVETDGITSVSLAAVDTAVYALNSKNKLTPGKVFKAMNGYDLGCSPGGGKDYRHVFMDAGLAFISTDMYSMPNEFGCKTQQRKKRSSTDFQALVHQRALAFPSPELQRCCRDGMTLLPRRMVRTCGQRASRVAAPSCRDAFRACCDYAEKLRTQKVLEARRNQGLGRTQEGDQEDDDFEDEDIQLRSNFAESWFWKPIQVNGKRSETVYLPHSITTWEIQGVGMSPGKGFCVAEPVTVTVFKPFHIHLRVPFSVKRFEQMELRPVLYNYHNKDLEVEVYMEQTEGICSPGAVDDLSQRLRVTVKANSALPVPFAVVPIGKSHPVVTVVARAQGGVSDSVKKVLQIVREGVSEVKEKSYIVDPQDPARSSIDIDDELPSNMIPDGDFRTSIRVSVDSPMNTINNSLSAEGVSKLIRVPYGCAEQTMISTSPGVYALRYLDHTEKWTLLSPERKDEALDNMRQGYLRILQFRKTDGSYGAWIHRASSTWLTAFVVKVLALCRRYIDVDVDGYRGSANYLPTMQLSSGAFQDPSPVIHLDMQGGVHGETAEVSLTAYVTVALHHSLDALSEDNTAVKLSISRAVDYLRGKLASLSDTYPLALTTYALTLTSTDTVLKDKAYNQLLSKGRGDPKRSELYFGQPGSAVAVETTAYALLTALLRDDILTANQMYTWLSEQQNYGGGFKSTQDTVMALEALSEYWIRTYKKDKGVLEVKVTSLQRQTSQRFSVRSEEEVQEELRSIGTSFNVKVSGKGKGVLTVLKMYNVMQTENATCPHIGLEVTASGEEEKEIADDYDYGDEEMSDQPRDAIGWHDLRGRARREVSQPKEKETRVSYEVCLWRNPGARVSGMAIVDITLLSGFEPNTQDLNKLTEVSDRYISHYEVHSGRLLMYFDKVPDSRECVFFDAVQHVKISLLQPASATVYDFYEPERRCTVFYGAPSKPNFISTLCSGDVCQCAEGPCPQRQRSLEIEGNKRQNFACYHPRVMFGYRVEVKAMKDQDAFVTYECRIAEVLQRNADENIKSGDTRSFFLRTSCKTRLSLGKEYLVMGQDGQTKDESGQMRYLLQDNFWIEELTSPQQCSATRFRNMCLDISTFMDNYRQNGCMV